MGRPNSTLPTHRWLALNKLTNYLAAAFVFCVLVVFIAFWTVRYSIDRNCQDYYNRDVKVFSYWIKIQAGSTHDSCPVLIKNDNR